MKLYNLKGHIYKMRKIVAIISERFRYKHAKTKQIHGKKLN